MPMCFTFGLCLFWPRGGQFGGFVYDTTGGVICIITMAVALWCNGHLHLGCVQSLVTPVDSRSSRRPNGNDRRYNRHLRCPVHPRPRALRPARALLVCARPRVCARPHYQARARRTRATRRHDAQEFAGILMTSSYNNRTSWHPAII